MGKPDLEDILTFAGFDAEKRVDSQPPKRFNHQPPQQTVKARRRGAMVFSLSLDNS